jgi:hypothetical protein
VPNCTCVGFGFTSHAVGGIACAEQSCCACITALDWSLPGPCAVAFSLISCLLLCDHFAGPLRYSALWEALLSQNHPAWRAAWSLRTSIRIERNNTGDASRGSGCILLSRITSVVNGTIAKPFSCELNTPGAYERLGPCARTLVVNSHGY